MISSLDGPSVQGSLSVSPTVVSVVKVGADPFDDRKLVTLQPTTGKVYLYFGDATVAAPSAATVAADGIVLFKNAPMSFEATNRQPLYLLAVSGTIIVKVVERA